MNSDEEIEENEKENDSFEHLDIYTNDSDFELISNNIKDKLVLIKYLSFNNTKTWLACGTKFGLRLYSLEKLRLLAKLEGPDFIMMCGVSKIKILGESYISAIVVDGKSKKYSSTKIYLFDIKQKKILREIECYNMISQFEFSKNYLIYSVKGKFPRISIYNIRDQNVSKSLLNIHPRNLTFTTNNIIDNLIIAYIKNETKIAIYNVTLDQEFLIKTEYNEIQTICLNKLGNKIAVSNNEGTYISIFNVQEMTKIIELYRGRSTCFIKTMIFSENDKYFLVYSDRETFHLYDIGKKEASYSIIPNGLTNLMQGKYTLSLAKQQVDQDKTNKKLENYLIKCIINAEFKIDEDKKQIILIKDNGDYENFVIDQEKLKIDLIHKKEFLNASEILENASLKLMNIMKNGISLNLKKALSNKLA